MKKIILVFSLCFVMSGVCTADENDQLPQMMRVQVNDETVLDSKSRLRILLAISNHLSSGNEIVIKSKSEFKESVHRYLELAKEGKMVHSSRYGIGSIIPTIKRSWGDPQGDYREKEQAMMLYKDKSITFKYPASGRKVREVSCHSFFGSLRIPPQKDFIAKLGKPYKEYNLRQIVDESRKNGISVVKRLRERGILKKTTTLNEAMQSGELDIRVVIYKADKYFMYMTQCRVFKDTKFYRAIGVRMNEDVFSDPWFI